MAFFEYSNHIIAVFQYRLKLKIMLVEGKRV